MIANTSGVSTKRNAGGGTIKMSSKAGDDGSANLLMGIPGHTNYQVSDILSKMSRFLRIYSLVTQLASWLLQKVM